MDFVQLAFFAFAGVAVAAAIGDRLEAEIAARRGADAAFR